MRYTINQLFENEKFSIYISDQELNYFKKFNRLKNKDRFIKKLKKGYSNVEAIGRGSKLIFELNNPIENPIIDKREIAKTNPAVLLISKLADKSIGKDLVGHSATTKNWLRLFGFEPFYDYLSNLEKLVKEKYGDLDGEYNNEPVLFSNYKTPTLEEVITSTKVLSVIDNTLNRFYGYLWGSIKKHCKNLSFTSVYYGIDLKDNTKQLEPTTVNALKEWEKRKKDGYKTKKAMWDSCEYQEYIINKLKFSKIWKEDQLIEVGTEKTKPINNTKIQELVIKMLIDSTTKRELQGKVKIDYALIFKIYDNVGDDILKSLYPDGIDNDEVESKVSTWEKLMGDRLLTKIIAEIVYITTQKNVDLSNYYKAYKQSIQKAMNKYT